MDGPALPPSSQWRPDLFLERKQAASRSRASARRLFASYKLEPIAFRCRLKAQRPSKRIPLFQPVSNQVRVRVCIASLPL
jgi:hypothetical protein